MSTMIGAAVASLSLSALLLLGIGVLPLWAAGILAVVVLVLDVLLAWCTLALNVKRLHDLGKSGPWLLVGFIPLGDLFLVAYLWLFRGTSNQNASGSNST